SYYIYFLVRHCPPREPHSFPTRRSSDLWKKYRMIEFEKLVTTLVDRAIEYNWSSHVGGTANPFSIQLRGNIIMPKNSISKNVSRSEEHTSELQSRENLVCRLLLEKKKHN